MMTSTTKTMVLLIAIMMLAEKINAGCNHRNTCRRNNGREERLWNAAESGNLASIKHLLKITYVDPTPKYGETPLIRAARQGHKDVVQALLDNNANIDHQQKDGLTALILATRWGHKDVVQELVDNEANVNHQDSIGRTAIMAAAYMGHKEIARVLIDNGANIDHQDSEGWTALMYAARFGRGVVVRLLLNRGAHINLKTNDFKTACDVNKSGITIGC